MLNGFPATRGRAGASASEILALVAASFGPRNTVVSKMFWDWKHDQNPSGKSIIEFAHDDDGLVALRAFMPWRFVQDGDVLSAVRAVDTVTHPRARGKGHFTRLTMQLVEKLTASGVGFVYNTPNQQSLPGYLKMGWVAVGRVPLWLRVRRPLRMARAAITKGETNDVSVTLGIQRANAVLTPALDRLFAMENSRTTAIHTPVSIGQWRWRYGDVPGFQYGAVLKENAVVVARQKLRRGLRELSIAEFVVRPTLAGIRDGIRALRELLVAVPSDHAIAVAPLVSPAAAALSAAGFIYVPHLGPLLTVRSLAAPAPAQWREWSPSLGDLELF